MMVHPPVVDAALVDATPLYEGTSPVVNATPSTPPILLIHTPTPWLDYFKNTCTQTLTIYNYSLL